MLRRIKLLYQIYNYFQREKLGHLTALYDKYGINKAYHSPVSAADFEHLPPSLNTYDKVDSREKMPETKAFRKLDAKTQQAVKNWSRDGYVVIRDFFGESQIDAINYEVDRLMREQKVSFRHKERKLEFAIRHSEVLRKIGNDRGLKNILELLLDKEVSLFQSLNFITGSQQRTHSDSIHMTTYPLGNLIAVWVALEDVGEEQGPLHYYPGSHKLPYLLNQDLGNRGNRWLLGNRADGVYEDRIEELAKENNFEKKIFTAKKGDILIWHANLLHGGEPVKDLSLTRKSMVLHYFGKDAICYHEITQRPALMEDFSN
jgi:ectoine hydroxylase-related dioxygenase (phytanoyl-CoA dioxygenase family)